MPQNRLVYIDNLRVFLIVLVVLLHVSIIYGGAGNYPIKAAPTDALSPILLTFFNAVCQSFFMSLFFFLSGYFVPQSFDRKGARKFFTDRLIRLGIPLLVYTTLFRPLVEYCVRRYYGPADFSEILMSSILHPKWIVGPLWFVEALLIFTAVYVLYRLLVNKGVVPSRFPKGGTILVSVLIMGVFTFVVRIFFKVGVEVHVFQIAHFVHYIFFFWLGIMAYRANWLEYLDEARIWRWVALATVVALPLMFLVSSDLPMYFGGRTWQSAAYSLWESFACMSISISLLLFFQKRYDKQGSILRWLAPNFYVVYIIHALVVMPLVIMIESVELHSAVKFLVVSLLALVLCFLVGSVVRMIPGLKRVLG